MFEWFNNMFSRPKYPSWRKYATWDDIPEWNKINNDMSNEILFPKSNHSESQEESTPAKKESKAVTYYRLGITSDNRVSFQMVYNEIVMTAGGVDALIKQLEFYRDSILANNGDQE
jgi:hypothetical protein